MAKIINIHSKKEPSLLDVKTRFNIADMINEGKELRATVANNHAAPAISINTGILFGWEVFRNELEFE